MCDEIKALLASLGAVFVMFLMFVLYMLVTGCTISINQNDTHGTASDLIDENQSTNPEVITDLKLPKILGAQ